MNKLYYIVCDDKNTNVFEGRYQGRTRGEALKFLKQSLGRKSLNGLVFTITEIPVPLIREIVAEMLAGSNGGIVASATPAANVVPITRPEAEPKAERFDAFTDAADVTVTPAKATPTKKSKPAPKANAAKVGNPGHGDDYWQKVRAHWEKCRSIKETAEKFGLSPNTVKTRAYREGWNK